MVRSNRIKQTSLDDLPIGSLTATATGIIDTYMPNPINGFLQTVIWQAGNHTATGSLFITISGANTTILTLTSGATTGMVAADFTKYPRVVTDSTLGIKQSGANGFNNFAEIPINGVIHVVGSGLGNGTSGLGLNFTYV